MPPSQHDYKRVHFIIGFPAGATPGAGMAVVVGKIPGLSLEDYAGNKAILQIHPLFPGQFYRTMLTLVGADVTLPGLQSVSPSGNWDIYHALPVEVIDPAVGYRKSWKVGVRLFLRLRRLQATVGADTLFVVVPAWLKANRPALYDAWFKRDDGMGGTVEGPPAIICGDVAGPPVFHDDYAPTAGEISNETEPDPDVLFT